MHKLYDLKDKLIRKLEEYGDNGDVTRADAEEIKMLSASVDHLCNICKDAEGEEDGYSGRMYPDGMGGSYRIYSREGRGYSRENRGGYSNARGRMNASRDSMGRYSGADGMEDMETVKTEVRRLAEKIEQM